MSIYCNSEADYDGDYAWWWSGAHAPLFDTKPLATKRSRRCCSCHAMIHPGEEASEIARWRDTHNDIEERIYGAEFPLASWFMCETCSGLALSLIELGFNFNLGDNLKEEIAEYRRMEKEHKERSNGHHCP